MKIKIYGGIILGLLLSNQSQAQPTSIGKASQAEVNAGVNNSKFVTPLTLKNAPGGGGASGASATNFIAYETGGAKALDADLHTLYGNWKTTGLLEFATNGTTYLSIGMDRFNTISIAHGTSMLQMFDGGLVLHAPNFSLGNDNVVLYPNGANYLEIQAVGILVNGNKVVYESIPTNGVANLAQVDFANVWAATNQTVNFTITALAGVETSGTRVQNSSRLFINTSGSTKTITVPASWIDLGSKGTTLYNTNQGVLSVMLYPGGGTNYLWVGK